MSMFQIVKAKFQQFRIAASVFLVTTLLPIYARADLTADEKNATNIATGLGQWVSGIGFVIAGIVLFLKFLKMQNADNDGDYNQARKAIKWSAYGLIGAAIAEALVTYIKSNFS